MSDVDEEHEDQEETLEPEAVRKLADRYRQTPRGEEREEFWDDLSAEDQEALAGIGVTGPAHIESSDEDEGIVGLNKSELRKMTPESRKEAEAEFNAAVSRAQQVFDRGIRALTDGGIDARQHALDEIARLRDEIEDTGDEHERGVLIQKAAQAIESLRGEDSSKVFNPSQVKKKRQYHDPIRNRAMLEETDVNGNKRVSELDKEKHRSQFDTKTPDNFPEVVSHAEFLAWDHAKRRRFINKRPDDYEALLLEPDEDARQQRAISGGR